MIILKQDLKKGHVHVRIESPEDLWYLSHLVDPGDTVRGSTERKLKIGGEDARNQKVVRKKMTLTLLVEKSDFSETLRVLGTITDGPDDVPRGEHHSFTLQPGDDISITKQRWAGWQLEKLNEAKKSVKEQILVVLFDRENALYALLTTKGHKVLGTQKGQVQKKDYEESGMNNFWKQIAKELDAYDHRYTPNSIIAASPAFWKDYLKKELGEALAKKTVYATVSDTDENGLTELTKRPELKSALANDRSAQEQQVIDGLLAAVAKDKCAYGMDEVETKANEGALQTLSVSDTYLKQTREDETYERLDALLKTAEGTNARINIITTKEASKQLDGLGGVAGITRW